MVPEPRDSPALPKSTPKSTNQPTQINATNHQEIQTTNATNQPTNPTKRIPQNHQNREEGEFGEALVQKKVRVFRPEQLRYVEVNSIHK